MFCLKKKYRIKLAAFLVLVVCVYCEFVSYWTLPWTWIELPDCLAPQCKKLLLVSDPQIIGLEWKNFFFLDALAIWDSDRYLKKTFAQAVDYVQPDIIVFLGDLMDQGHISTDLEFKIYVKRLENLFRLPNSLKSTKVIFSPGDNDIGGIDDILVPANIHRFEKTFNYTENCDLTDFIEFCKVNLMTSTIQESKFITSNIIRVALSHVPLTPKQSYFLQEVVKKIRPKVIFSGHFHTSWHFTTYENDVWMYKHSKISPQDTHPKIYKFHEGIIHEIIVPTCSYRMGVTEMGYGAAFIDTKKQLLYYNVLWLPRRYNQIFIYLVTVLPVILLLLVMFLRRIRGRKQMHLRYLNQLSSSYP